MMSADHVQDYIRDVLHNGWLATLSTKEEVGYRLESIIIYTRTSDEEANRAIDLLTRYLDTNG